MRAPRKNARNLRALNAYIGKPHDGPTDHEYGLWLTDQGVPKPDPT